MNPHTHEEESGDVRLPESEERMKHLCRWELLSSHVEALFRTAPEVVES